MLHESLYLIYYLCNNPTADPLRLSDQYSTSFLVVRCPFKPIISHISKPGEYIYSNMKITQHVSVYPKTCPKSHVKKTGLPYQLLDCIAFCNWQKYDTNSEKDCTHALLPGKTSNRGQPLRHGSQNIWTMSALNCILKLLIGEENRKIGYRM